MDPIKGLVYKNYGLISKQRNLAFNFIKQIGINFLNGRSIMDISFPVTIFDKASVLHTSAKF